MPQMSLLVIVEEAVDVTDAVSEATIKLEPYNVNAIVDPQLDKALTYKEYSDALAKTGASFGAELDKISFNHPTEEEADTLTEHFDKLVQVHDNKFFFMTNHNEDGRWLTCKLGGFYDRILPSKKIPAGLNAVQKLDLDVEAGEELAVAKAVVEWNKYLKAVNTLKPGPSLQSIVENTKDEHGYLNDEDYRMALLQYQQDIWVKTASKAVSVEGDDLHEYFFVERGGKKAFLDHARNSFITVDAVLTPEDEWVDRTILADREMEGTTLREEWAKEITNYIKNASDTTWFLVYTVTT